MVHPIHVLRPGGHRNTLSRIVASTVLPNPVGFLRLSHAQKPNRYRARGTASRIPSRDCRSGPDGIRTATRDDTVPEAVMRRFYRSDKKSRNTSGFGLGLSLVSAIVNCTPSG